MASENRCKLLSFVMKIVTLIKKEGYKATIQKCVKTLIWIIQSGMDWSVYIREIQTDKKHGVDFVTKVHIDRLEHTPDSCEYEASNSETYSIIEAMNITPNNNFIDIGCGKGKAIYILSKLPFTKIDGIEYSSELAEIARNNLTKMKVDKSTIYNMDASEFKKYNEYDYFYMYNPFGESTMSEVVTKIEKTLEERESEVYVIYANPLHSKTITKNNLFQLIDTINATSDRKYIINIYCHYPFPKK